MNRLITLLAILLAVFLVTPVVLADEYPDLSPAAFFGYTNQDKTTENTRKSMDSVADEKKADDLKDAQDCRGLENTDIENFRSIYPILSPAEFFYDIPQPDTKVNPCIRC